MTIDPDPDPNSMYLDPKHWVGVHKGRSVVQRDCVSAQDLMAGFRSEKQMWFMESAPDKRPANKKENERLKHTGKFMTVCGNCDR